MSAIIKTMIPFKTRRKTLKRCVDRILLKSCIYFQRAINMGVSHTASVVIEDKFINQTC